MKVYGWSNSISQSVRLGAQKSQKTQGVFLDTFETLNQRMTGTKSCGSPSGDRIILGKLAGAVLKCAGVVAGGIAGLAIAPFVGICMGAYGGLTGDGLESKIFNDPALPGSRTHEKIEEKTGSKVLAAAGGFAVGVPGGVLSAFLQLPILGAFFGYVYADIAENKLTGLPD